MAYAAWAGSPFRSPVWSAGLAAAFAGGIRGEQTKARRKIRRKENSSKAFFRSRLPFAGSGQEAATHRATSGPAISFAKRLWVNSFGIRESPLWRLRVGRMRWSGRSPAMRRGTQKTRMLPCRYGVLLRRRNWVKKAGASSRTPYDGSNAQAFRPAYGGVAAFVEAEEAVGVSCDSDADADANLPCRSRCGPKPERALRAHV